MDPVAVADILHKYGPWGICALLIAAVIYLHKGWNGCQESRIADAKLATEALTRQASTNAELAVGMASLRDGQTEIMRIVSLMQRDAENGDERTKEKLAGLVEAVSKFGDRLTSLCRGAP